MHPELYLVVYRQAERELELRHARDRAIAERRAAALERRVVPRGRRLASVVPRRGLVPRPAVADRGLARELCCA